MAIELFDMKLRALRRDRAARAGPELFLFDRSFEEIVERIAVVQRRFRSALLIGCPDPRWPERLTQVVDETTVLDPGPLFAAATDGSAVTEDRLQPDGGHYDLCLAIGTLDTVNALPTALQAIRESLLPDSLFIGAISGGDTLPLLRSSMRAADEVGGVSSPHVHPRIAPSALGMLLTSAGFTMPVVDIDRVRVTYPNLGRLVADLRAMGGTNVLKARSRAGLTRAQLTAANRKFGEVAIGGRATEVFEILHFAGWSPSLPQRG